MDFDFDFDSLTKDLVERPEDMSVDQRKAILLRLVSHAMGRPQMKLLRIKNGSRAGQFVLRDTEMPDPMYIRVVTTSGDKITLLKTDAEEVE